LPKNKQVKNVEFYFQHLHQKTKQNKNNCVAPIIPAMGEAEIGLRSRPPLRKATPFRGMAQAVDCLPSKCKGLISNTIAAKKKKRNPSGIHWSNGIGPNASTSSSAHCGWIPNG
jgi:hypothetical protein